LTVDPNVALPFASSVLSLVFSVLLFDQWRARRRPYQAIWAIGMLWYGLSAGTEFLGGAFGWSEPLYRAWYLIGAIWVAGWLGLGTAFLLARTRFGYAFAVSLGLAGLFTYLSWRRYDYPGSGISPWVYLVAALILAVAIAVMTYRGDARWPRLAAVAIVGGSILSAAMVATAPLAAPGYVVDPQTHIPTGALFPGYLRLLTPFFNITGAFSLTLGALFSAYVFMPKVRLVRYRLQRGQSLPRLGLNLALALVGLPLNLAVSLPGAAIALVRGRLNSRVPATMLIALGGLIPAITSGLNRFGDTSGFFVGELLGVVFLFGGFLVSTEVFHDFRVPFTSVVLRSRTAPG
jgi:hypothetical protein